MPPVIDSRESSCSTESSIAEQEFAEIQEQQARDRAFNKNNQDHTSALSALRMESNARLTTFTVPVTPPTSKTETMKLLEQLQTISTNLVEMGKAQVEMSGRYLQCLRAAHLIRNRLELVGVSRDTHGLAYSNQDGLIRAVARVGCNRALRIFERQSLTRKATTAPVSTRIDKVLKTQDKPPRKPRAKKVPLPVATATSTQDDSLVAMSQYTK